MKHTLNRMTAALATAALAGLLTACGSTGVTSPQTPDVRPDQNSTPETTAAVQSTQTENQIETQNEKSSDFTVPEINIPDGNLPDVTIPEIHIDIPDATVPDINEYMYGTGDTAEKDTAAQSTAAVSDGVQTITDASGDYTYTGALFQGGDDENGYLKIPEGFANFIDLDVSGLTQYSDATRLNIFTLDHYEGIAYKKAGENLRAHKEQQDDVKDLKCNTVTIAGYRAVQLYATYDDGIDVVNWFIEDPDDPDNSTYYLAMEFDKDHQYMIACSSTFQTIADHNK